MHRFTSGDGEKDKEGKAQIRSAGVVDYIRSMEVDTELFTLASETAPDDILVLPEETLVRLNVVNNGRKKPKWTIESVGDGIYLKGEQHTMHGMNTFLIVFPVVGDVMLHVMFDARISVEHVMQMEADRLVVDDEYLPMREKRHQRVKRHSIIQATYGLDDALIEKIGRAKRVGMIFQWDEDAPVFLGFDSMPFEEGATKLPGLVNVFNGPCERL